MKKLFIILICGTVIIVTAIGIVAWLSWQPQSWYSPPDYSNEEVKKLADRAEFDLIVEFQRADRDPPDVVWHIRIRDREINAWLSGRPESWLTHDKDVEMPEEIQDLQVHMTPEGVWVAAMVEIEDSEPRPVAVELNVWIENGKASFEPTAMRLGKIPIPLSILQEVAQDLHLDANTVDAIVRLSDNREVEIQSVLFEDGAIVLTCQTLLIH